MAKIDPKVRRAREQAQQKRRSRRLNTIIIVLLLGILLEALYLVSQSKLLGVSEIKVKGNERVSSDRIVALSGITAETSVLRLQAGNIEKRIARETWIEKATVVRRFPFIVEIRVSECQPAATVVLKGGVAIVDKRAKVLQVEKENVFPSLPEIRDSGSQRRVAAGAFLKSRALSNALSCLNGFESSLKSSIVSMSAPSIDGLALQLRSGLVILYGKAEFCQEKNYAVKAILAQAEARGQKLKYIDVRVPSNPAAMPE